MTTTLTGILAWIYTIVTLAISGSIMLVGALVIWNKFILIPILNHLRLSKDVWDYMTNRELFKKFKNDQDEFYKKKEKELSNWFYQNKRPDEDWFDCIERIQKGQRLTLFRESKYDQEWLAKLCRTLGYSDDSLS